MNEKIADASKTSFYIFITSSNLSETIVIPSLLVQVKTQE